MHSSLKFGTACGGKWVWEAWIMGTPCTVFSGVQDVLVFAWKWE